MLVLTNFTVLSGLESGALTLATKTVNFFKNSVLISCVLAEHNVILKYKFTALPGCLPNTLGSMKSQNSSK